ncbi:unspecified product [Leishmania tarentolae]|uniref:Unspecified product n=1 Tax=Leishmania tarentolae TaxID=5689 RepID=A0A640KLR3_LEITA|nr:unspecified product [Leishmania tarentolae]
MDHALLTGSTSSTFDPLAIPRSEAYEVNSARTYYNLTRLGFRPCAAGKGARPESQPCEIHHPVQKLMMGLSRPPQVLATKPLADLAHPQRILVPADATGSPEMLRASSPNGTLRPSATYACSSLCGHDADGTTHMLESSVAEKAKAALHTPSPHAHMQPRADITASPFCMKHAFPDRAYQLRNHHVSQTRTPQRPEGADVSATLWSEAALQRDALAFIGSQDEVTKSTASSSLRVNHTTPVSTELSWGAIDTENSSFCDIFFSDSIFSGANTVMGSSHASGVLHSHVIDPEAVIGFHRDGARRQRQLPKAVRDVELQ